MAATGLCGSHLVGPWNVLGHASQSHLRSTSRSQCRSSVCLSLRIGHSRQSSNAAIDSKTVILKSAERQPAPLQYLGGLWRQDTRAKTGRCSATENGMNGRASENGVLAPSGRRDELSEQDRQFVRELRRVMDSKGLPKLKVPTRPQLSDRPDLAKGLRARGRIQVARLLGQFDASEKSAPAPFPPPGFPTPPPAPPSKAAAVTPIQTSMPPSAPPSKAAAFSPPQTRTPAPTPSPKAAEINPPQTASSSQAPTPESSTTYGQTADKLSPPPEPSSQVSSSSLASSSSQEPSSTPPLTNTPPMIPPSIFEQLATPAPKAPSYTDRGWASGARGNPLPPRDRQATTDAVDRLRQLGSTPGGSAPAPQSAPPQNSSRLSPKPLTSPSPTVSSPEPPVTSPSAPPPVTPSPPASTSQSLPLSPPMALAPPPVTPSSPSMTSPSPPVASVPPPSTSSSPPVSSPPPSLKPPPPPVTSSTPSTSPTSPFVMSPSPPVTSPSPRSLSPPVASHQAPATSSSPVLTSPSPNGMSPPPPATSSSPPVSSPPQPTTSHARPATSPSAPVTSVSPPVLSMSQPATSGVRPVTSSPPSVTSPASPATSPSPSFAERAAQFLQTGKMDGLPKASTSAPDEKPASVRSPPSGIRPEPSALNSAPPSDVLSLESIAAQKAALLRAKLRQRAAPGSAPPAPPPTALAALPPFATAPPAPVVPATRPPSIAPGAWAPSVAPAPRPPSVAPSARVPSIAPDALSGFAAPGARVPTPRPSFVGSSAAAPSPVGPVLDSLQIQNEKLYRDILSEKQQLDQLSLSERLAEDEFKAQTFQELGKIKEVLESRETEVSSMGEALKEARAQLNLIRAKSAAELSQARQEVLELQTRLRSAEKALEGLKQVRVEYWGQGESVQLAGSFNGWGPPITLDPDPSTEIPLPSGGRGPMIFACDMRLYPGDYEIKFIVDGTWQVDSRRQIVYRGMNQNNLLRVE